ncbi:MAG: hypothetical protein AAF944_09785 [Bacteroidota bacterium]
MALLALQQCRRWARERNQKEIIYQNQPAIPTKVYDRGDTEPLDRTIARKGKISTTSPLKKDTISPVPNAWDV